MKYVAILCALAITAGMTGVLMAQDGQRERGERRGPSPEMRQRMGDPEQMREMMQERMMQAMRQQLRADDEEWEVIEPRLQRVFEAQLQAQGGGMGMVFAGGMRGRGMQGDDSPVAEATRDLMETLRQEEPNPEEVRERLMALRDARRQAQAELAEARRELTELLTQRQEAVLVMAGILE